MVVSNGVKESTLMVFPMVLGNELKVGLSGGRMLRKGEKRQKE